MQKILIIDDNKNNIISLTSLIQEYLPNITTISALSGKQGIELAKKIKPNTILLDVRMPGLNGFETSKILKNNKDTKNIPIILLTAYEINEEDKIQLSNCGADVFFDKFYANKNKILIAQIKAMININKKENEIINKQQKLEDTLSIKNETLQSINYKYKTIFENSGTGNLIVENDMTISLCNSEAEKISGYTKKEIEGKMKFYEFLKEPYLSLMKQYHIARRKGNANTPSEYKFDLFDRYNNLKNIYLKIGLIPETQQTIVSLMDITKTEKLKGTLIKNKIYFEELLKVIPEAVAILDKDGNTIKINKKFTELFGYSLDDFKNKNFDEIMSPDYLIKDSKHITSKTGLGEIISCETKRKHKNGNLIDVALISNSFEIAKGDKYVFGIYHDITERKKSEIELKKYNSILSASNDRMAFIDKNYIYQAVNKAFCKFHNLSYDKIINHHVKDIIGVDTFNKISKPNYDLCFKGKNVHFQTWYEFPVKGKIYLDVALTPNYDNNNNIIGLALITRDITKLKNIQDDLIIAKERAEESDKLKSAFLSNMSHEIRTPMNAIIGFSSLLATPDISKEEKDDYIKHINIAANNLLILIDDILDISKIDANQVVINKTQTNLNKILYEIYCQFNDNASYFENKDINFLLNAELLNNDFIINTDESRLIQIFYNLINNAFKFTKNGIIEFGCSKITKEKIEFYVKDTGIGIPEDKINFIFDRFRQVDGSHTRKYGGTGLGLAITKKLIELLGGEITVTSKQNFGSTFYFSLPLNDDVSN
ncbi:MAG: PAS domain S-box protein [Bacteroidales bacterium]|nr:PAS domain S-box protein [Bacteroidales bacterium]